MSIGILTQAGHKPSWIASHLGLNARTVQRIAARHRETGSTAVLPRSGRPKHLVPRSLRSIQRHAKQNGQTRAVIAPASSNSSAHVRPK